MPDKFETFAVPLDGPATGGFAVTPNDSTVFSQPTRILWVGGAGAVAVRMLDGTSLTLSGVPAGSQLQIRVDKVLATGTTATNIVGLF